MVFSNNVQKRFGVVVGGELVFRKIRGKEFVLDEEESYVKL